MLVHSEDSIAFVLTGGLTLYKLLKITHFLRHGGSSHFCIITIVQLFLPTSSLYITAGKSWYYYPLQKRNFPLHGGIFETLPLNYNFLVLQYWNSNFFCNKRHTWSFPATHFFGAILFFVFHEVLSFQCARACVMSVSSAGFYVLSLSLSLFLHLSNSIFWALTPLHNAKCPL